MESTQERRVPLRRVTVATGIAVGMAAVAVLSYATACKGLDKQAPQNVTPDNNAATGYLLHEVLVQKTKDGQEVMEGTGEFECAFRCVATLISFNVIATSRT